jgi:hypothetical protein
LQDLFDPIKNYKKEKNYQVPCPQLLRRDCQSFSSVAALQWCSSFVTQLPILISCSLAMVFFLCDSIASPYQLQLGRWCSSFVTSLGFPAFSMAEVGGGKNESGWRIPWFYIYPPIAKPLSPTLTPQPPPLPIILRD